MNLQGLPPLPADLAADADGVIDAMIGTAARQVTATRCDVEIALESAWSRLHRERPEVWALAVIRLHQTGNQEMYLKAYGRGEQQ